MNQFRTWKALVEEFSGSEYLETDPIKFPHRYRSREDIEVSAFISALFSYGNVHSIFKFLEELFLIFGNSPSAFLLHHNFKKSSVSFPYYRFQSPSDVQRFLRIFQSLMQKEKTLETFFNGIKIHDGIINLQKGLISEHLKIYKENASRGLLFLIGSGSLKSANKRYLMFLRWMSRRHFPDFGLYETVSPSHLLYPLDTHILKLSKILGMNQIQTADWKSAELLTEKFREIFPKDPVQADFALSRLGILKLCRSRYEGSVCEKCSMRNLCTIYEAR
ncbi:MAG TPA: TIGR02757 family protein [Leptospiraceae bacterium]|nr:TIGR02757 family protein [Leptospiraceae bacterium]